MSTLRDCRESGASSRIRIGRLLFLVGLGTMVCVSVPARPARAQSGAGDSGPTAVLPPRYRMPAVLPEQFASFAGDSLRAWARAAMPKVRDRAALFAAVQELLRMDARFAERVAKVYPRGQLEWITITDRAGDTLAVELAPVLAAYRKVNPEEVLTGGRIAFEDQMSQLVNPPGRMLGFHVVALANRALAQADSLLSFGGAADVAGVQDGALRALQDWVELYGQVHADVIARHESHLSAEDWVLLRLQDNCGNAGPDVWRIKEMYVAKVGVDSTVTPPEEQFAHEYTLASLKCPTDTRVVYLDMPLLQAAQREIYQRTRGKEAAGENNPPR